MLNFSMIDLVRRNGKKVDKNIRGEMVNFYRPFRYIPCFLQSSIERVRKKTKKLPVVIKFAPDSFSSGLNDVKETKCRSLREYPSISCCSAKLSVKNIEHLITNCNHIQKVYLDRKVTTLLDTASPAINANVLKDNGLTGEGVTIAVIDTGIHPHEDLQDRIIGFKDFVNRKSDPYDDNGHGTHCAGDAAGNGLLSNGQYQAPASQANLVGVKVLDKMGAGSLSTVIEGIEWCIQHQSEYNIDILSLSLGSDAVAPAEDDPVVNAVEIAWDNGMVVCVAAGNSGPGEQTIASPGISPKVITVGAADDNNTVDRADDSVADFSSRGPTIDGLIKPDLLTPGVDIISLRAPRSFLDKTNKAARVDTHYMSLSGTSMATPICAGVIAQLLQRDPNLTPDQVKERLLDACDDLGQSPHIQGAGYLNASDLIEDFANVE
ncbi:S8 family peptidase [Oceanobacillus profundus]|uniref:Peptidase S8 n=1 Tax=Oceanobacillus profundus TaxID=372463 RepID=A0A417YMD3_9BACI|nr:S8 family peptidase [Oceanobacillus profundus]MBR3118606.1 S8 family peptidase [Oceanobacillus sp.]MCM3399113.1 S8 family peptidase [Oceanobacillus profundus]PAE29560.1 peptidase S8 [Paenibacillus sp. 7884-2]RHW34532.1 peptidase S8 [Oceanobacillus profundus]